jgi:hypothetical protein
MQSPEIVTCDERAAGRALMQLIGASVSKAQVPSAAASGARGLSATWCPDSMMGFQTAKSTIIPAVFDLAPNRQITANWQIRRHAPAVENH